MSFPKFAALLMTSSALMFGASAATAMQAEAAPATQAPVETTAPAAAPADTAAVTVGGAEMLATKNIIENASASADHSTLVAAIKSAGLVETLSGPGPFTVFAPTNDAFKIYDPKMLAWLMKPENKEGLAKVLKYHVVAGAITADDLKKQIEAGGGKATLTTVEGSPIVATIEQGNVLLTDVIGGASYVTQADVKQSNGVIHVVNGVLTPKVG